MKYVCPLIVVNDIDISRRFYEEVLNQQVKYDYGENVTFEGDFAIHLKSHYQGLIGNKEIIPYSNGFELYFEHDDLEIIIERLKAEGVVFVHEIIEQPWKQRVLRFYDPDGHLIEVGESLQFLSFRLSCEGFSVEKICGIINMPEAFVNHSIGMFS